MTIPRPDALTEHTHPESIPPCPACERAARADAERELAALREALRRIAHSQESDLSVYARFAQEVATAALAEEESR